MAAEFPAGVDRQRYVKKFRDFVDDARALCEEAGEPLEVILPLYCMNVLAVHQLMVMDAVKDLHRALHNPAVAALQKKLLADMSGDEPWKEDSDG